MLALLTNTILVRVKNEEEAGEIALMMTEKVDSEILTGFEQQNVSIEEGQQVVYPLGVLVQIIPENIAE